MSAIAYWRERLAEGFPLYNLDYIEGEFVRIDQGAFPNVWPFAVAKQTLYADYLTWFDAVYLHPYTLVPYYRDNPMAKPAPDKELTFFASLGPLIYVVGQPQQDRSYKVDYTDTLANGAVVVKSKRCNFVRLCPMEAHIAMFEQRIGTKVAGTKTRFDPKGDELIRKVIEAVTAKNARIERIRKINRG